MSKNIPTGTVHGLPTDLRKMLQECPEALAIWNDITPLARNEWICWIISVKQEKTRQQHIERAKKELSEGKRRPCCWIGCIHRKDKAVSPSVKAILRKKS